MTWSNRACASKESGAVSWLECQIVSGSIAMTFRFVLCFEGGEVVMEVVMTEVGTLEIYPKKATTTINESLTSTDR